MGQEPAGLRLRGVHPGQPAPGEPRSDLGRRQDTRYRYQLPLRVVGLALRASTRGGLIHGGKPRNAGAIALNLFREHRQGAHPEGTFTVKRAVYHEGFTTLGMGRNTEHFVLGPLEMPIASGLQRHAGISSRDSASNRMRRAVVSFPGIASLSA